MNATAKKIITYLGFLGISVTLLYLTFRNTEFSKINSQVQFLHWGFVLLSFFAMLMSHFLRAWRWQLLLKPIGYNIPLGTSFYAIMIGYLTNYIIPRGGELARCGVVFSAEKIPIDKLLGTVILERLIDLLLLIIVFLLTLFLQFDTVTNFINFDALWREHKNLFFVGIFILCVLVVIVFIKRKSFSNLSITNKILFYLKGFNEGLSSVFKIKNQLLFWLQSVGIWLGFFLLNYLFIKAMPITESLTPVMALVLLVMSSVSVIIPAPGGIGSYHYIIKTTLVFYAISEVNAEAYALVSHTVQSAFIILVGIISLFIMFIRRKKTLNNAVN